jgi:probable HAF family extracellular repeat protein
VTSGWLWKGTWTPNIDPDSRAAVDLGILGGTMSFGYNVNPAAHVVGVAYLPGDTEFHAYSWTPERGMVDIGLSGYSAAFDVNASGRVVGGNGSRHAFSWTEAGGMTDLGTLGGVFSEARAVNASGQIAGQSSLANDAISHAFSWTQAGGMVDLGSLGERQRAGGWVRLGVQRQCPCILLDRGRSGGPRHAWGQ